MARRILLPFTVARSTRPSWTPRSESHRPKTPCSSPPTCSSSRSSTAKDSPLHEQVAVAIPPFEAIEPSAAASPSTPESKRAAHRPTPSPASFRSSSSTRSSRPPLSGRAVRPGRRARPRQRRRRLHTERPHLDPDLAEAVALLRRDRLAPFLGAATGDPTSAIVATARPVSADLVAIGYGSADVLLVSAR
jgi:hypothetical protein